MPPVASDTETPMYLTAAEVANLLRISLRTLYAHVQQSRVPMPIWLGSKRLWPAQALHDFLGAARNRKRR